MKRIIATILALVLCFSMLVMLVSCATGECESCGKTARLSSVTFLGEKIMVCSSCKKDFSTAFK